MANSISCNLIDCPFDSDLRLKWKNGREDYGTRLENERGLIALHWFESNFFLNYTFDFTQSHYY